MLGTSSLGGQDVSGLLQTTPDVAGPEKIKESGASKNGFVRSVAVSSIFRPATDADSAARKPVEKRRFSALTGDLTPCGDSNAAISSEEFARRRQSWDTRTVAPFGQSLLKKTPRAKNSPAAGETQKTSLSSPGDHATSDKALTSECSSVVNGCVSDKKSLHTVQEGDLPSKNKKQQDRESCSKHQSTVRNVSIEVIPESVIRESKTTTQLSTSTSSETSLKITESAIERVNKGYHVSKLITNISSSETSCSSVVPLSDERVAGTPKTRRIRTAKPTPDVTRDTDVKKEEFACKTESSVEQKLAKVNGPEPKAQTTAKQLATSEEPDVLTARANQSESSEPNVRTRSRVYGVSKNRPGPVLGETAPSEEKGGAKQPDVQVSQNATENASECTPKRNRVYGVGKREVLSEKVDQRSSTSTLTTETSSVKSSSVICTTDKVVVEPPAISCVVTLPLSRKRDGCIVKATAPETKPSTSPTVSKDEIPTDNKVPLTSNNKAGITTQIKKENIGFSDVTSAVKDSQKSPSAPLEVSKSAKPVVDNQTKCLQQTKHVTSCSAISKTEFSDRSVSDKTKSSQSPSNNRKEVCNTENRRSAKDITTQSEKAVGDIQKPPETSREEVQVSESKSVTLANKVEDLPKNVRLARRTSDLIASKIQNIFSKVGADKEPPKPKLKSPPEPERKTSNERFLNSDPSREAKVIEKPLATSKELIKCEKDLQVTNLPSGIQSSQVKDVGKAIEKHYQDNTRSADVGKKPEASVESQFNAVQKTPPSKITTAGSPRPNSEVVVAKPTGKSTVSELHGKGVTRTDVQEATSEKTKHAKYPPPKQEVIVAKLTKEPDNKINLETVKVVKNTEFAAKISSGSSMVSKAGVQQNMSAAAGSSVPKEEGEKAVPKQAVTPAKPAVSSSGVGSKISDQSVEPTSSQKKPDTPKSASGETTLAKTSLKPTSPVAVGSSVHTTVISKDQNLTTTASSPENKPQTAINEPRLAAVTTPCTEISKLKAQPAEDSKVELSSNCLGEQESLKFYIRTKNPEHSCYSLSSTSCSDVHSVLSTPVRGLDVAASLSPEPPRPPERKRAAVRDFPLPPAASTITRTGSLKRFEDPKVSLERSLAVLRSPSHSCVPSYSPHRYSYTEMLSKVCSYGITPSTSASTSSLPNKYKKYSLGSLSQVSELWSDLTQEQSSSSHATEILEAETTERMRLEKEVQDLQSRYSHVQQKSDKMEMEMMEARVYRTSGVNGDLSEDEDSEGNGSIYKQKYERAVRDMEMMKRRIQQQHEEEVEQNLLNKKAVDKKLSEALEDVEEERQVANQWKRKAQKLSSELQDLRLMLEEQMSRNGELEKKQRRFDSELNASQEEIKKERLLREKLVRERDQGLQEKYSLEQELHSTRLDMDMQHEKITQLNRELDELSLSSKGEEEVTQLKRAKQELERKNRDQEEELEELAGQVQMLEQAKLRLEMSLEKLRQEHRRESSVREEEIEELRASFSKKIKNLEAQLEAEQEDRHQLVKQKHELERRVIELTDQPPPQDPEIERRLRKDLKRTKALLRDAQSMLEHVRDGQGNKSIIRQLKNQLEDAEFAKCAAIKAKQGAEMELQDLQSQFEEVARTKNDAESRCLQLSREKSAIQTQLEEMEEEMSEVMKKYKAAVAQMSIDQKTMSEQTQQITELETERHALKEQLSEVNTKFEHLAGQSEDTLRVHRLDGKVRDLESKLELEQTTRSRLEHQIARLKEQIERSQEECDALRSKENQAQEGVRRFQRQIRDIREDYAALQQKEADAYRKQHEIEIALENAESDLKVTKNDLRLACQRIEELKNALEDDLDSGTDVPDDSGSDSDSSLDMSVLRHSLTPIQRCDSVSSDLSFGGRRSITPSMGFELSAMCRAMLRQRSMDFLS